MDYCNHNGQDQGVEKEKKRHSEFGGKKSMEGEGEKIEENKRDRERKNPPLRICLNANKRKEAK